MFNPSEPRDTGGKWLRMGRGDLEKVIHNLVRARAEDIAAVNGKGGNEAHIKKVQAHLRARILRNVKVAPTYHIKIDQSRNGQALRVHVPGDETHQRIVIPNRKMFGNVDNGRRTFGKPRENDVVAMRDFGRTQIEAPETGKIKAKLRAALPSGITAAGIDLTNPAHRAAERKRVAMGQAGAVGAPTSRNELWNRWIEAALADKKLNAAEERALRAAFAKRRKRNGEPEMEYLRRLAAAPALGRVQRGAVFKMNVYIIDHGGFEQGSKLEPGAGSVVRGILQGNAAEAEAKKDRLWNYVVAAVKRGYIGGEQRDNMLQAMAKMPRKPGEGTRRWLDRMDGAGDVLGLNRAERAAARRMKVAYINHGPSLREGNANRAAGRAARRDIPKPATPPSSKPNVKGALSVALPPTLDRIALENLMRGKISEIQGFKNRNVSDTYKGKAEDGTTVFLKRPYDGVMRGEVKKGTDPERELAGALVANKLRVHGHAHVVIRTDAELGMAARGENVAVQNDVGGKDLAEEGFRYNKAAKGGFGKLVAADVRRTALLDSVIGNLDRHIGNGKIKTEGGETRFIPIDNSLSFPDREGFGSGNDNATAEFYGKNLNAEELTLLRSLERDQELWGKLGKLLSDSSIMLAHRRIAYMIQTGKFLPGTAALTGQGITGSGQRRAA